MWPALEARPVSQLSPQAQDNASVWLGFLQELITFARRALQTRTNPTITQHASASRALAFRQQLARRAKTSLIASAMLGIREAQRAPESLAP